MNARAVTPPLPQLAIRRLQDCQRATQLHGDEDNVLQSARGIEAGSCGPYMGEDSFSAYDPQWSNTHMERGLKHAAAVNRSILGDEGPRAARP